MSRDILPSHFLLYEAVALLRETDLNQMRGAGLAFESLPLPSLGSNSS